MGQITGDIGTLGVLNVANGDTKLSFDPNNPQERIRAARIVKDMLRRGYALMVDDGNGIFRRVTDFDESKCEYIIADFDPVMAAEEDEKQGANNGSTFEQAATPTAGTRAKKNHRIPAEKTRGVSIARSAGG